MSTFLIVVFSALGVVALAIGVLGWLFFHQGGCCVKKAVSKINRKCPTPRAS